MIEEQLDTLTPRIPRAWWWPWVLAAGGLGVGLLLSRVPLLPLVRVGASAVQTGVMVAGTVTAVDRFLAERRRLSA